MLDREVKTQHVQQLNSRDAVASFFSYLGYDVEERTEQRAENLGITADSLKKSIEHIENLATQDGQLRVLLVELKSVTVAHTRTLVNSLRNLSGDFLLVLTSDYERIDFVLLERVAPEQSGGTTQKQVKARPRVLTVERRNPEKVDLRVLRRMTYTEDDPWAQYDKLVSAFGMAEWSEEHFDNRALFSDYYLSERMREMPEWEEAPRPAFLELRELYESAPSQWANKTEGELRAGLILPTFEVLGHEAEEIKAADDDAREPDYVLHGAIDASGAEPRCICLTYPWARSLDGKDYTRDSETPEENPGALVVSLLRSSDASFAIVTNGKTWRLYSSKTHSMATRFYQVDLPEILARDDPSEAFRYFWLIFRAEAFAPRTEMVEGEETETCFAELLIDRSRAYAKRLGERLKDRVFEEIFPHFAQGFIQNLCRETGRDAADLSEEELDEVYHATLTLLYRLLFLLYAESRDLLPVRETRGYWEVSLKKMKQEVAEHAGNLLDETEGRIEQAYDSTETDLYERLKMLFEVVDEGKRALNVPTYNGGLFVTDPEARDTDTEAKAARFLAENTIPDQCLALGLDRMARDLDEKTQGLVFIDYKSLDVDQLGSIYEGLLEFKVRVAEDDLAVVKKKKTYRYKEYSELTKTEREKLPKGRATTVQDGPRKGEVYLENDKRQRKATGSYYTPGHIVNYIVHQTVGPVLDEKFKKVRRPVRDAQKSHSKLLSYGFSKRDAGRKAFQNHRGVVDQLFDVKVLDPAMGSGHFLVETVRYVSERMIDFLNAFPWNPVRELLEQTRRTIQQEMDEQDVTIDPGRLTDVNLMKRHVLKRCIYGVDLNPMAVELAKLSLWLDCFTLGAPLSFLDHHLRCGNSLVGTKVARAQKGIEGKRSGKGLKQMGVFASAFTGLERATQAMLKVGKLTDVTADQVQESKSQYQVALSQLRPYKALLHVWLSEHFGNDGIQNLFRDYAQEIETSVPCLLEDRSRPDHIPGKVWAAVANALDFAEGNRFFHWELEFPEVWYEQGETTDEAGFDAVVGNPPYDVLAEKELGYDVSDEIGFFKSQPVFQPAIRGKNNLYKLFICRGLDVTGSGGMFSFIVPMALLGDDQSADVRRMLLNDATLQLIEAFPQKDDPRRRVFREAKLSTTVFVVHAAQADLPFCSRTHPANKVDAGSSCLTIRPGDVLLFDPENGAIPSCTQKDWDIATELLRCENTNRMQDIAESFQGEVNETNERRRGAITDAPDTPVALRGANICLYAVREPSQGEEVRVQVEEFLRAKGKTTKAYAHKTKRVGFQRSSPQNNYRRIIAAPIQKGEFCLDTVSYVPSDACRIGLDLLMALLNSQILDWFFRLGSTNSKVNEYQFDSLPIPTILGNADKPSFQTTCGVEVRQFAHFLGEARPEAGIMPKDMAEAISVLCRRIQEIEADRELSNRSERSRLAAESQRLQDIIDAVLFRCYGVSDEDAEHIKNRLGEML